MDSKPLILVVDDAPLNIKLLRTILEPAGYAVCAAGDGEAALRLAKEVVPALILLDLMMPGMDGFAVCQRLKEMEATRQIPVIVVTGRDDVEVESRCFALGAADYMTKPISLPVVLARVKMHLALDSQRRSLEGMFRDVMEFAPDAIILSDVHGCIMRVNRRAEQMFGYHRQDLVGRPVRMLVPDDPAVGDSLPCLRRDGSGFPADINRSPLQTPYGELTMAVVRDVTERHKADLALAESRQQLRALVAQNEADREEEHKHLAREVHDELGQILTALRMDLSLLDMRFGALDPALGGKVQDMKGLLDRAIQGVRNVVANLRPIALDMGLIPALENLCAEFAQRAGMECVFQTRETTLELDETRTVAVYRIVQESLTNTMRYARATRVTVTLGRAEHTLGVEVQDNGQGFDMVAVSRSRSFGLLGMRERALALGGHVDIVSTPGQGVVVAVAIPLDATQMKDVP